MKIETFSKLSFTQIILLVLTFLLGMAVNLFINIPSNLTGAFWQDPSTWIVRIHMFLGTAILAISIILFINSMEFIYMKKNITRPSIVGLVSVSLAYLGGLSFLFLGADNIFSYIMAIGFLSAIINYVIISVSLRK